MQALSISAALESDRPTAVGAGLKPAPTIPESGLIFRPVSVIPPRAQIVAGLLVMAALALAQLVIVLLHYWPSSVALWVLYFEFARRVDSIYRLLRAAVPIDAVEFIVLLLLAAAIAGAALRARVRLLEAVAFHAAFGCAVLVLLDNLGLWRRPGIEPAVEADPGLLTVLALFVPCAFMLAAACWRIHRQYIRIGRRECGQWQTGS